MKKIWIIAFATLFTAEANAEDVKTWLGIGAITAGAAITIAGVRAEHTLRTYNVVPVCAGSAQAYACPGVVTAVVPPTIVPSSQSVRSTNWKLTAPGLALAAAGGTFTLLHKRAVISLRENGVRVALKW